MGVIITRATWEDHVTRELDSVFKEGQDSFEHEFIKIFKTVNMGDGKGSDITKKGFTGVANPSVVNEGEEFPVLSPVEGYKVTYTPYKMGGKLEITQERLDDGRFEEDLDYVRMLGRSFKEVKEERAADVLNNGFTASFTGPDGVCLFNNAHPIVDNQIDPTITTYDNLLVSLGDFSTSSVEQAALLMPYQYDNIGRRQRRQKITHIVGPTELQFEFDRFLGSEKDYDSAENAKNPHKGKYKPIIWSYLNGYTADFPKSSFVCLDMNVHTLTYVSRKPIKTTMKTEPDGEMTTWLASERYTFGYDSALGVVGCKGTA